SVAYTPLTALLSGKRTRSLRVAISHRRRSPGRGNRRGEGQALATHWGVAYITGVAGRRCLCGIAAGAQFAYSVTIAASGDCVSLGRTARSAVGGIGKILALTSPAPLDPALRATPTRARANR